MTNVLIVMLLLVAHVHDAAAQSCSGAVQLGGPERLRDAIREALIERGIATSRATRCPTVIVGAAPHGGIRIDLVTDEGVVVEGRQVSDAKTAAAVIETWARPELYSMLLPQPTTRPSPVVRTSPLEETEQPPVMRPPLTSRATPPRFMLSTGLTPAVGADGSMWLGATARACVQLGSLCAGTLARASTDTRTSGDSAAFQTARTAMELMLSIDVSRRFGGVAVNAGGLLGLGFDRRRRDDAIAGNVEADGGGVRAGLHVGASMGITAPWAIGVDTSLDAAIFAPPDAIDPDAMELAGQPRSLLRFELLLRYEAR